MHIVKTTLAMHFVGTMIVEEECQNTFTLPLQVLVTYKLYIYKLYTCTAYSCEIWRWCRYVDLVSRPLLFQMWASIPVMGSLSCDHDLYQILFINNRNIWNILPGYQNTIIVLSFH